MSYSQFAHDPQSALRDIGNRTLAACHAHLSRSHKKHIGAIMPNPQTIQQLHASHPARVSGNQIRQSNRNTPIWLSTHTPDREQIRAEKFYITRLARMRRRIHRHPGQSEMWHMWWKASVLRPSRKPQVQLQKRRSISHRRDRKEVSRSTQIGNGILAIGLETHNRLEKYATQECQIRMGI